MSDARERLINLGAALGSLDPEEARSLRARIAELEAELAKVTGERDELKLEVDWHHPREMSGINREWNAAMRRALAAESARDDALRRLGEAVEALKDLRTSAALLQQNAEGCAVNHYGADFSIHGMPGWLVDTAKSIATAAALVEREKERERGS